jgi:phenylpropionate dioxygenase-like ring-hydroxylating dioxygenase large terminal subunit
MSTDVRIRDDAPIDEPRAVRAPRADQFPKFPVAWYVFCRSADLHGGPYSKAFLGRRIVAYRTRRGAIVAMDARCSHMGTDLGAGQIVDDCIQCPFHDWRYGPDGRCLAIPAQAHIPAFARQKCYSVDERHGLVFLFNGEEPLYPLPFFDGVAPGELMRSRPFGTVLDCPWYVSGANAFDLQHFRAAHDRRLVMEPNTIQPSPYSFAAVGVFAVEGRSLQDRMTRRFAGDRVKLSITDWCGGLSFAQAEFRRTSTFGLVAREPLEDGRVRVDVYVFARKGRNMLRRMAFDPLHLEIRRLFIKRFLTADAIRLNGVRYRPERLIEADQEMINYYRWLAVASHGRAGGARADDLNGLFSN